MIRRDLVFLFYDALRERSGEPFDGLTASKLAGYTGMGALFAQETLKAFESFKHPRPQSGMTRFKFVPMLGEPHE
jgi:hypothetical protein